MNIIRFDHPGAFAERAHPFLMRREAENCFFIGLIGAMDAKTQPMLVCIEDDRGEIVGVGVKSPDRHLMLTDTSIESADALAQFFAQHRIDIPGVQSAPTIAARFAEQYCKSTQRIARPGAAMAIHALCAVNVLPLVAGKLRAAREDEVDLLADWFERFAIEIGHAGGDRQDAARQRIGDQTTFLWEANGQVVCTASVSGPTPNGIRINLVYTPPPHRGRGYATACVSALSERILAAGRKFCFLFTDLANPTSNKIYRAIGYEKVCEQQQIFFDARAV